MRQSLGTAVFSGMLGVTLFGIVLTPVFFFSIDWLGESRLFTSPLAQTIGGVGLSVLRLEFLWKWKPRNARKTRNEKPVVISAPAQQLPLIPTPLPRSGGERIEEDPVTTGRRAP